MSLKADLKALRARLEAKRPPEVVALMHRAVDELRASGATAKVPKVGDPAPRFVLPNADERPVDSQALLARGPLVATDLGATLVAISPQRPAHNRELIAQRGLGFDVLTDRGNDVAAAYGLRFTLPDYLRDVYRAFPLDLATYNGDESWTLPIPARFVIDPQGVVRWAESDPDYTTRPEPAETVAALRAFRR